MARPPQQICARSIYCQPGELVHPRKQVSRPVPGILLAAGWAITQPAALVQNKLRLATAPGNQGDATLPLPKSPTKQDSL